MMNNDEPDIDLAADAVPLTAEVTSFFDPLKSGFLWYTPPLASEQEHKTGGHTWNIVGHDMQILTMTVPAGDKVITEVGSFMYMSPFMETSVEFTLFGESGFSKGCNRICGGESCVKVYLKNESGQEGYVGLTPNYPAKVIPVSVPETSSVGGWNWPRWIWKYFFSIIVLTMPLTIDRVPP